MQRSPKYAASPDRIGGPDSHTIPERLKRRSPIRLEKVTGVNKALEKKSTRTVDFDPSKYGKKIGNGVYGTVYSCKVTPTFLENLKKSFNAGVVQIITNMPALGSEVIVKIQLQKKHLTDDEFEKEVAHENSVHKELTSSPNCYKIPMASKPTCISDYAPKFYMSFVFGNKTRNLKCVTVMDSAGDISAKTAVSMTKVRSSPQRFATIYVSFEKAITSLWLAGYAHGDLHRDNIMVNSRTGKVNLIDFGFAIKLPPAFVQTIADGASKMIAEGYTKSFADIWTDGLINGKQTLRNYTNRVMSQRDFPWYNPDYKVLQTLYNDIPKGGKQLIPTSRSNEWGVVRATQQKASLVRTNSLESGEIRVTPIKKKTPWKPRDGKYWADESSPSTYVSARSVESTPMSPTPVSKRAPTPKALSPKAPTPFDKVNAKGRKVYKNIVGRTYVEQNGKKVYVKKLFTPKAAVVVAPLGSPMIDTGKVDAKKRKVFKDTKGRTYVKPADKKVFVKKLFTPKASAIAVEAKSPVANTGKVNAKKRKVFKDTKGRTYVKQNNKKVYVKKLFTPR